MQHDKQHISFVLKNDKCIRVAQKQINLFPKKRLEIFAVMH
jgi:hypothetical protein